MNHVQAYSQEKTGLHYLITNIPNMESCCVCVMLKVGSIYEDKKVAGGSHLIEHMMFKGTKNYPNALDLSRKLDSMGAQYNAYTTYNYTCYYIKIQKGFLHEILEIIGDMTLQSKFREKDIVKEKDVVIEELRKDRENSASYVSELFQEIVFKKTAFADPIGGSDRSVKEMNYDDIYQYWKNNYRCSNMVISIAGNLGDHFQGEESQQELDDEISLIFNDNCPESQPTPNHLDQQIKPQKSIRVKVEKRSHAEQLHLCVGFPLYFDFNSPRKYAAHLLRIILAGNMSSRFFHLLREKYGIAYNVSADVYLCEAGGSFSIHTGVSLGNLYGKEKTKQKGKDETVDPVYVIIKALMEVKKQNKITQKELDNAKQYLRGMIYLGTEDSQFIAEFYGKAWLLDMPVYTIDRDIQELEKVSLSDVQSIADEFFDIEKLNVAAIGNVDEKKFQKYIKSYQKSAF